jgi:kynureninase
VYKGLILYLTKLYPLVPLVLCTDRHKLSLTRLIFLPILTRVHSHITTVFGSSTTQLFRNLSYTLTNFAEGDELVISSIDHEANIASWLDLAARHKLTLKWWTPAARAADGENPNPRLTPESLRPLLSARTRLITCTHASNILGSITEVVAITALVRAEAPGALVAVDGVAYAPHRPIDVQKLGVDFYCFSWYVRRVGIPFRFGGPDVLAFCFCLVVSWVYMYCHH